MSVSLRTEGESGVVHYDVETSAGGRGIVVYEVNEVYVYIPAELSAAGFELKIAGCVRITDKSDAFYLKWTPIDLTNQDVACLYSAQADGWTVVDQFVEPPEVIEPRELSFPDRDYHVKGLDMPEPILQERSPMGSGMATSPTSPDPTSRRGSAGRSRSAAKRDEEVTTLGRGDLTSKDGDARVTGLVSHQGMRPALSTGRSRTEAVNFSLSHLHSVRDDHIQRCLKFFLRDGQELPTLYFHDGGTYGLLQAMQRYVFLVRDPSDLTLYRAESFGKKSKKEDLLPLSDTLEMHLSPRSTKGLEMVHGVVSGAMSNVLGITRAVRQHLLPDRQLLEVRPGTEVEDEMDEKLQTMAISDVRTGERGGGGGGTGRDQKSPRDKAREMDPEASLFTDFQIITDIRGKLPPRPPVLRRQPPVSVKEWESYRDPEGRISAENEKKFRARVFSGGIEPCLRREVWRYLLNYFPFDATDIQRMEVRATRENEYWAMKSQWKSIIPEQEKRFRLWRETRISITKDVLRTDRDHNMYKESESVMLVQLEDLLRTYAMYNFDLGYVQGMSDLLAPLLVVMENEVDAFWCFAGYMDMVGRYFELSQSGMRTRLKQLRALLNVAHPEFYQFLKEKEANNLYFCFRWLLVDFKREFPYEDIMRIWEVLWTKYLSPDYSLFIAMAILELEKEHLSNPNNDFSDILQHVNRLSHGLTLDPILQLAEVLCRQLGNCQSLPEDLNSLVVRPPPRRLVGIPKIDTIVCDPDSSSVPTKTADP